MTISELIAILEERKSVNGDCDVLIIDEQHHNAHIESVTTWFPGTESAWIELDWRKAK